MSSLATALAMVAAAPTAVEVDVDDEVETMTAATVDTDDEVDGGDDGSSRRSAGATDEAAADG